MKQTLITISFFLFSLSIALGQGRFIEPRDIQALQEGLPKLKGIERIDLLNKIANHWQKLSDTTMRWAQIAKVKHDSISAYATMAYNESAKLNYEKGKGIAMVYLAHSKYYQWWDDKGHPVEVPHALLDTMDLLLNSAQPYVEKVNDHAELAEYYILRGDVYRKKNRSVSEPYISNWKKAINEYELAGDIKMASESSTWLSFDMIDAGHLNDALDYSLKSLQLAKDWQPSDTSYKNKDWKQYLVKQSLENLANIAENAGDYYTSLNYLNELDHYQQTCLNPWYVNDQKVNLFIKLRMIDSAKFYQKKAESRKKGFYSDYLAAKIYLLEEKYAEAIPIFVSSIDSFIAKRRPREMAAAAYHAGEAYYSIGSNNEALKYVRMSIEKAKIWGKRAYLLPAYELLSKIHHSLGDNDSAYAYLKSYVKLKDSIQNAQLIWQLHKARKDASVALLMKDNQIQASEIRWQAQVRNILIATLLLLLIAAAFIWRNISLRKKYERTELMRRQAELQQQAQELEMKALKAQMNPHFIFNSLSSINWFILKNKTQEASDYLTSFSRLIRMVLTNSEKPVISLDEELKMLRLYLDMEQLRLAHSFDYKIEMMNSIDPAEIYMPPMILQPFCENAIWHGLSHKPEKGLLAVNFELQGHILNCTIADNGVGREKAAELKNSTSHKEKSLGIQITKSRLSLFNGAQKESEYYSIEDVVSDKGLIEGTMVTLKIKPKEVA
jgi:hypothetical protein